MLILSCIVIPLHTSLYITDEDQSNQNFYLVFYRVLDCLFSIDIIVTFNTAIQVTQVAFIEDRKTIACQYLKFWFWIDLMITLPYDLLLELFFTEVSKLAYLAKLSRLIKIVRLLRMLKLLKIAKRRETVRSVVLSRSTMSAAVERLILFIVGFLLMCHLIACVWIIQAKLHKSEGLDWIS